MRGGLSGRFRSPSSSAALKCYSGYSYDRLSCAERVQSDDEERIRDFGGANSNVNTSVTPVPRRYKKFVGSGHASGTFGSLSVVVLNSSEALHMNTFYNYSISINSDSGTVVASTIYGAIYGLETFSQLVLDGKFNFSSIEIYDEPNFRHRGVMIDSGRRFVPVESLDHLFLAMQYNKLNVLHLHLSDWCRVAIESKKFPMLTEKLVGLQAGFYTQDDIKYLVKSAGKHGIQIEPEFDLPGHAAGFAPLEKAGMKFCDDSLYQVYGDPENKTLGVLKEFLTEILPLFPNELVHFGCDELSTIGLCNQSNFARLESQLFEFVHTLGKRPVAWEESYYTVHSVQPYNIVNTWTRYSGQKTTKLGYDAIENAGPHFYLNHIDYLKQWVDIFTYERSIRGAGASASSNADGTLFGGELSMWTDNYCYIAQCGTAGTSKPKAASLYDPKYNSEFQESIMSVIFPRGIKAAGSFWRFDGTLGEDSAEFQHYIRAHNDRMQVRGIQTCPNECSCDELKKCNVPYIKS